MNGCPAKCVCYSEPRPTVACQQQGLFSIPTEIPVRSQRIFLQSNKLTVVRSTSFSSVHNLTVLWMYSNNISHIEADIGDNSNLRIISPTAFRGLTKLHTLHLHRCGLSELPVGVFRGLFSLQYLYLQDNNLLALHEDTFLDLANLTYLFLHNNKIKVVTDHMLRGLTNLDRLLLHQNRIIHVQQRAFNDLGKLTTLFLFFNNLTMLTGEAMNPLVSLQYLRLNGNQWICDCRARPLWDWFKRFKGSSSELECHLPTSLTGKDLKRLKSDDLEGCVDSPKSHPDPSSYNSRQITNNPLKEKENISKTKFREVDQTKNDTRNKQSLNDGPLGTMSNHLDQTLDKIDPELLDNLEPSTAPSRKKKKCSKKPKSDHSYSHPSVCS
ncbi:hypothetical protein PO909_026512 [Leuciscus waleckii]